VTDIDRFEPAEASDEFILEAAARHALIRAQWLRQFPIQQASDQIGALARPGWLLMIAS
jgi:hypothetical protein